MLRFLSFAIPTLLLILAIFGVVVDTLDLEPRAGAVLRLSTGALAVPAIVVLGGWIMETCGLLALYLLAQGRCGNRWLDGLVAGWLAWVFRGPIFVVTIVVATRQPQDPWWRLAFAWWVLYSVCGLALAALAPSTQAAMVDDEDADHEVAESADRARHLLADEATPDDVEAVARIAGDDSPAADSDSQAPEPEASELPFKPGDEDPTDRHPSLEILEAEARQAIVEAGLEPDDDPSESGR